MSSDGAFFLWPPLLLLLVAAADSQLRISADIAGWPFVISLVVLGLPHGAIDWLLVLRQRPPPQLMQVVTEYGLYLGGMVVMLGLLVMLPLITLTGFAIASGWHFGKADEQDLEDRFPLPDSAIIYRRLTAAGHGCILLAIPFAAKPEMSAEVILHLLTILGSPNVRIDCDFLRSAGWAFLSLGSAACLAGLFVRGKHCGFSAVMTELGEQLVIALMLFTVHPLFGIGIYFLVWHSWRHWRRIVRPPRTEKRGESTTSLLASGLPHQRDSPVIPIVQSMPHSPGIPWLAIGRGHLHSLVLLVPTMVALVYASSVRLHFWSIDDFALLTIATFVVVTPSHDWLISRLVMASNQRAL